MNTVGKTLVILNLVFALLVAGFLVMDFATRNNWKTGFDKLKSEFEVARANTKTAQETNVKLLEEKKAAEANLNLLEKKLKAFDRETSDNLEKARRQSQEEADKAKAAEFNLLKITSENARLQAEIKDLVATLKKREADYFKLQDTANTDRQTALQREQEAKSANARAMHLLEQLRQKELELVKLTEMGKGGGTTTAAYSPKYQEYLNPPPVYVKGVVLKVDTKDVNLARISLGSDEGLKEGHTMFVYRLSPNPDYVGTLRIRAVDHHTAVGQLIRPAGAPQRTALKEGDEVASKIIR
jgi:hypothetical protein